MSDSATARSKNPWHYTPALPVSVSPYFRWPPDLRAIVRWMISGWFPVSERLIILLLAIVSALLLQPVIENTTEFSFHWIAHIYIRNLALMCLVAGSLHLYFYIWRRQGDDYRFDARPLARSSRIFTFNSQVHDNMFWTLASGVTIWTAYEVLMLWALSNGYAPALSFPGDLPWLVLLIFLLPMWETTHFFLIHRLIHNAPLYQRIHALHHRNTNVGPWSGLSMHPLEHTIYLSTVLIHFVIPSSPLLIIFHLSYFTLSAATTHTGYHGIVWRGKLVLPLGTFHHQLHHRYFTCNYGGLEAPWDQWTGSFHDGTAQSHQQFLARRRNEANT
ncbi:desaturase [Chromatiales bacterium (ex Bugula neritina AB1)]|nr:desaturase [Chromatiales bacterium (ex Bugula neritina AB1)]